MYYVYEWKTIAGGSNELYYMNCSSLGGFKYMQFHYNITADFT